MHVELEGLRLWFDVEGPALVPDGLEMHKRPTAGLRHGGPGSFDHTCFKPLNGPGFELMRGFDVLEGLTRLDCPTLVRVGELDPVAPITAAREIADALPEGSVRLEVIESAGHFTWKDAPNRYWPLLTDFVTTTP